LADRKHFKYPPFYRMIRLVLLHKKADKLQNGAKQLAKSLSSRMGDRVLGPEFTIIPRISNYYQQQILMKIEKSISISKVKDFIQQTINSWSMETDHKSIRVKIDVDPM